MDDLGAISAGAGTEVANAGSDAGTTTEVATPATETPSTEPQVTGEGEQPQEGEDADLSGESAEEPTPEEDLLADYDGRKIDAKTRNAISALAKVDKEAAKAIRETYFPAQEIVRELGVQSIREAVHGVRGMKATIDGLGGEEGINELQTEVTDYRNEIEQFSKGDPELLNQLYQSNPEGLGMAISNGLSILMQKDLATFDQAFTGSMVSRLEHAGVFRGVEELIGYIKEGQGQEAYDLATKLQAWLGNAKKVAENTRTSREQRNPEAERLEAKAKELDARERQQYEANIGSEVKRLTNSSVEKVSSQFFRDIKLGPEGRQRFTRQLIQEVRQLMEKDKTFLRQETAIRGKGDAKRSAQFIHTKFNELLPEAFRRLRNELYPNYKPAARPVALAKPAASGKPAVSSGGNGASAGAQLVERKPAPPEIDYKKTSDAMLNIGGKFGEAVLLNGRRVRWDWQKQQ